MRTNAFDFSPLFRTAVGFDRMMRALENASHVDESALSYPPYNIERLDDDHYRITMAVAGFGKDDIEVVLHEGTLTVKSKAVEDTGEASKYLHRGIAARAFERRFQLAEHIEVAGADLQNGLLHVELKRVVPEELKPRTIEIGTSGPKQLEGKAA